MYFKVKVTARSPVKGVCVCVRARVATFHGLGRLDELGDGAGHSFGAGRQLLLQLCCGLLQDLHRDKIGDRTSVCERSSMGPRTAATDVCDQN